MSTMLAVLWTISLLFGPQEPTRLDHASRVPVLVYHHIANHAGAWYVSPRRFEQELAWLSGHDFHTVSLDAYITAMETGDALPPNSIVLTFDDGYADAYTDAFPLLRKYSFTGTFFVITGVVGWPSFLTWDQIIEMQNAGMEIGAHTVHHPFLTKLSLQQAQYEIEQSRLDLVEHLPTPPTVFAYPYNDHNAEIVSMVQTAGFRGAVVVAKHRGDAIRSAFEIPRITIGSGERLKIFVLVVSGQLSA